MSPTLSALQSLSKVVVAAMIICVNSASNATAAVGGSTVSPPVSLDSSATGATVVPAGWTALNMLLDGGAKTKTVLIRDDADASEVLLLLLSLHFEFSFNKFRLVVDSTLDHACRVKPLHRVVVIFVVDVVVVVT